MAVGCKKGFFGRLRCGPLGRQGRVRSSPRLDESTRKVREDTHKLKFFPPVGLSLTLGRFWHRSPSLFDACVIFALFTPPLRDVRHDAFPQPAITRSSWATLARCSPSLRTTWRWTASRSGAVSSARTGGGGCHFFIYFCALVACGSRRPVLLLLLLPISPPHQSDWTRKPALVAC